MNRVELSGRITRDPEVRYSQGEKSTAIARFNLAVQRKYKSKDGNYECDFINCVSMGKTGEFVEKYVKKGGRYIVAGHIQTGSYTNKEGQKVYTTEIMVDELEFAEAKNSSTNNESAEPESTPVSVPSQPVGNDFMSIPDGIGESLPFD